VRSVLITGCGFFTKHFVRRLLRDNLAERICVYSRDEWKQAQLRMELKDDARMRWFIGDVRDEGRLHRALQGVDTVMHGAALKRIEVGQYNPTEMVKTNVIGTMNVAIACQDCGVKTAVLLSSDKAYEPISPYGQSKALAESIWLASNDTGGANPTLFAVTRYGNVAGSTGSVIPIWRAAISRGELPVITDASATRFWMNVDEAVDLVLFAISAPLKRDKRIHIPTLPAFSLGDLAIAMAAKQYKVTFLPAWEKKHETLTAGNCSKDARRMSVTELREALQHVD
jgi:UDP-N-acetylglucosamine 4,6-dehydratase/5-epimerase